MNRRRWLAVVWAIALVLGLASGVAAQGNAADDPIWLRDDSPVTGTLAGNRGGSFVYYAIAYPGDDMDITVRVRYAPGDPVALRAVGFNVYGSHGNLIGEGVAAGDVKTVTASDGEAATWLIQVYNYSDGLTVSYTISVEGLPSTKESIEAKTGVLIGSRAGAFYRHELAYDGHEVLKLTLLYEPDDPTFRPGIGMTVYGPDGWRREATVRDGRRIIVLTGAPAGNYIVQVYNYIEGLAIHYTLTQ